MHDYLYSFHVFWIYFCSLSIHQALHCDIIIVIVEKNFFNNIIFLFLTNICLFYIFDVLHFKMNQYGNMHVFLFVLSPRTKGLWINAIIKAFWTLEQWQCFTESNINLMSEWTCVFLFICQWSVCIAAALFVSSKESRKTQQTVCSLL